MRPIQYVRRETVYQFELDRIGGSGDMGKKVVKLGRLRGFLKMSREI